MASIKGIELKGVRTFRGMEYPINYQGNVYFHGKKLGFWSQDGNGGSDHYEFNTDELDKVAKEYYGEDSIYDLDCLLVEVLNLLEYEKEYKKAIKEHFSAFIVISDGYEETALKVPKDKDKEVILKRCDSYIKKFEQRSRYKEDIKIAVYTDLADFVK